MPDKEAAARVKINKLLEAAGWRFFPEGDLPANVRIWEATVVEDRLNELQVNDGQLHLSFHPWQVYTLLLDEDMLQ